MGDVLNFPRGEPKKGVNPPKPYANQLVELLNVIGETNNEMAKPLVVTAKRLLDGPVTDEERDIIARMLLKNAQCLREISKAIQGM